MKKLFSIIMSILLIVSLTACGSQNADHSGGQSGTLENLQSGSGNAEAEMPSNEASGKKTLVVYYSATENTKKAAEHIASVTGGDLFELVPVKPYSREDLNWNDENSRVVYEYEHPAERKVALTTVTVDNFDKYDTVFIGYPIWWGIAAWPVNGFIEANDFTAKTVIPFCTSASSGLGDSGKLLKEAAGTGNWLEGKRFSSGVSETEVSEWIQNLDY
ncbi:MAG: flavodoxin [Oscillospiraceae bacterium]|jgi:flavodoxin|nr:flavodoxin [Oscillospiraceae bacterium]